jgi:rod shape-determining protein MreD
MADRSFSRLWVMRAAYLVLALVIMFFHLLPLDTVPRRWAPPDLLIGFTFAWALRRPEYVPAISIAAVMLVADLMFLRPPGLLALLVLLGSESLKGRAAGLRGAGFLTEWATVSAALLAITVLNRLVLGILMVPQAPFGPSLIQFLATIASYPLVVLVTQMLMGVRKPARRDARALGARI